MRVALYVRLYTEIGIKVWAVTTPASARNMTAMIVVRMVPFLKEKT